MLIILWYMPTKNEEILVCWHINYYVNNIIFWYILQICLEKGYIVQGPVNNVLKFDFTNRTSLSLKFCNK